MFCTAALLRCRVVVVAKLKIVACPALPVCAFRFNKAFGTNDKFLKVL